MCLRPYIRCFASGSLRPRLLFRLAVTLHQDTTVSLIQACSSSTQVQDSITLFQEYAANLVNQ